MQNRESSEASGSRQHMLALQCDLQGTLLSVCGALQEMVPSPQGQRRNERLDELLGDAAPQVLEWGRLCVQQNSVQHQRLDLPLLGRQAEVRLSPLVQDSQFLALISWPEDDCLEHRQAKDRQLRMLLEFMPLCAIVTRLQDSRVLYINPKAEDVLGMTMEQAQGEEAFR